MKFQTKRSLKEKSSKFYSWLNQDKLFFLFSVLVLLACILIVIPAQFLQSLDEVGFDLKNLPEMVTIFAVIIIISIISGILCKLIIYLLFGTNEAFDEVRIVILLLFIILIESSIVFIQAKEQLLLSNYQGFFTYIGNITNLIGWGIIFGIIITFTFIFLFRIIDFIFKSHNESTTRKDAISRIEKVLKNKKLILKRVNPQKESFELNTIILTSLSSLLTIISISSVLIFAYLEFTSESQKIEVLLFILILTMFFYSVYFTMQMSTIIILQTSGYVEVFQETQGKHIQGNQYFLLPNWYKSSWRDFDFFEITFKTVLIIPLISKITYYYTILYSSSLVLLSGVPTYLGLFLVSIFVFYLLKKKSVDKEVEEFLIKAEERIKEYSKLDYS